MRGLSMFAGIVDGFFHDIKNHTLLAHINGFKNAFVHLDENILGKGLLCFFSHG